MEGRDSAHRRSRRGKQLADHPPGNRLRPALASGKWQAKRTGAFIPPKRRKLMAYRVLITDDSPAMRSFVRRVIELSGFELSACFEAGDGAEALAVLQNEWVDAILTVLNMPGVDGEELLRRLAADEMLRGIPAIV